MPRSRAANDPLRRALEEIGRKRRSLEISGLFTYDALLQCPRVTRRARPTTTRSELAEYAQQAILEAIKRIEDGTDKAIAQAILCATEDFAGKTVAHRKDELATMGISADMYKERRPHILDFVVSFLCQDTNGAAPSGKIDASSLGHLPDTNTPPAHLHRYLWPAGHQMPAEAEQALEPLILPLADLYYAALCYTFVVNLTSHPDILKLRTTSSRWQYVSGSDAYVSFAFRLFRLICLEARPQCYQLNSRSMLWAAENMTPTRYQELCFMVSTLPTVSLHRHKALRELFDGLTHRRISGKSFDVQEKRRIGNAIAEHFGITYPRQHPILDDPSAIQPVARISVVIAKSLAALHILDVSAESHLLKTKRETHMANIRKLYSDFEKADITVDGKPVRVITNEAFSEHAIALAERFVDEANGIFGASPAMWVNYSNDEPGYIKWGSNSPFRRNVIGRPLPKK